MSNLDVVNGLLTAINFDRFAEIEAYHAPDAVFHSFRGPTLRSSVAISDWHREFQRDYADCNYTDLEYIEDGDYVVVRATIEAKGYDWRPFTQRVIEVARVANGEIAERRLYGMLRDTVFDKPVTAAMDNALGYRGGSPAATRKAVGELIEGFENGGMEAARASFAEKPVEIDGVYGLAVGFDAMQELQTARPRPLFGVERATHVHAGDHIAVVETSFDSNRPRRAELLRYVDGKVLVAEMYWMLREIGVNPNENYAYDRQPRRAILPV